MTYDNNNNRQTISADGAYDGNEIFRYLWETMEYCHV